MAIASVADKDSLFYETSTGLWKNYTPANARVNLGFGTYNSTTLDAAFATKLTNNIVVSSTTPAVTITQTGTGDAFVVNDVSPDSTPFRIDQDGHVGIGVAPSASQCLAVDSTGIKFSDATVIYTLNSIGLLGVPTAPTAAAGTNTTQLATTSFVTLADNLKANLSGATFTGQIVLPAAGVQFSDGSTLTSAFTPKQTSYQGITAFPGVVYVVTNTAAQGATGGNMYGGGSTGFALSTKLFGGVISLFTKTGSSAPMSLGKNKGIIDWSKKVRLATSLCINSNATANNIEPTGTIQCTFGKQDTEIVSPVSNFSATTRGIGWRIVGAGTSGLSGFIQLLVGNGTLAQAFTTTQQVTANQTCYIEVRSDGLGIVTLYFNGTLVYTTATLIPPGPTTADTAVTKNQTAIEYGVTAATCLDNNVLFGEVTTQIDM